MATWGTVKLLSRCSGKDLEYWCPIVTVSEIFSNTGRQWFGCFLKGHEITVLLPNCFKTTLSTVRRRSSLTSNTWRFATSFWHFNIKALSFVMWPVNSACFCIATSAYQEVAKLLWNSQNCVILIYIEQYVIKQFLTGQKSTVDLKSDGQIVLIITGLIDDANVKFPMSTKYWNKCKSQIGKDQVFGGSLYV